MQQKTWEEIAETIIVTSLPAGDIERTSYSRGVQTSGFRTGKSMKLHLRIVNALKEAYERGRRDERLESK